MPKKRSSDGWLRTTSSKLRGAYGESDHGKKIIRINKKAHKSKNLKRISPNKDGSENMLTTMWHEEQHVKHPKMKEKTIRKKERSAVKNMSKKAKSRLRSRYA